MNQVTNIGTNLLDGFIEDLSLVPVPPWWQSPWCIAAAILIAALSAFVGRKLWLRRGSMPARVDLAAPAPGEPPGAIALRRLAELRRKLGGIGSYEFCTECSVILREYIGPRFGLAILYQTTREFLEHAQTSPALGEDHREKLGRYLQAADKVKFGRAEMTGGDMARMIDYAEAFVRGSEGGKR